MDLHRPLLLVAPFSGRVFIALARIALPAVVYEFTSWAFTQRAIDSGLVPSMGSIGDCFDNAVIESFWSRMQVELLDRKRWRTRVELANAIFEYLEIFHNRQRRHSALGMITPVEFEARHATETAA
jgi:transposase InsO family protein